MRRRDFLVPFGLRLALTIGVRRPDAQELARAEKLLAEVGPGPWKEKRLIYANETLDMAKYHATVQVKLQAIRIGDDPTSHEPPRTANESFTGTSPVMIVTSGSLTHRFFY